jgi:PKD repeat protein
VVYFGSQASGGSPPYTFRWDLGDGTLVQEQSPNHTYRSAGRFVARLQATDSAQALANATPITIDVAEPPPWLTAAGEGMPRHGEAPLIVQFRNWAAGGLPPYTFAWDFGDGSAHAWTSNPVHVYTAPGDYFASVTVFDSQNPPGADSSDMLPLNVAPPADPLAVSASAGPGEGEVPLLVTFGGNASGGVPPYSYFWDFGDGEGAASAGASHLYDRVGEYRAVLVASDSTGRRGASAPITIKVGVTGGELAVVATAVPDRGPAPLEVSFRGLASGGAPAYVFRWEFGDGAGGFGDSPIYLYRYPGIYLARVEVTDADGKQANSSIGIDVGRPGNFTVSATSSPSSGPPPLSVAFGGDAHGAIEPRWDWNFGDGGGSIERDPVHVYDRPGNYWAVLTVTDRDGTVGSARLRIDVIPPPQIMIEITPAEWAGRVGEMQRFKARVLNGSGSDVTDESELTWDPPPFGEVNASSGKEVVFKAAGPGDGTLDVRARYREFEAVASARIRAQAPPDALVVMITHPANRSVVRGVVEVAGLARGMVPIDAVEVRVDNGSWARAEAVSANWTDWRASIDLSGLVGLHAISARASSGELVSAESRVDVIVAEPPRPTRNWWPDLLPLAVTAAGIVAVFLAILWFRRRRRRRALRAQEADSAVDQPTRVSRELRRRAISIAAGRGGSRKGFSAQDPPLPDPRRASAGISPAGAPW